MYTIGIIAGIDRQRIIDAIMAGKETDTVAFRMYNPCKDMDMLEDEVISDINQGKIHFLVLEYQAGSVFDGGQFWAGIHKRLPEFPAIVLADKPDKAKSRLDVDPDKVYDKNIFFDKSMEGSLNMVRRICRNADRYARERSSCESDLKSALEKLGCGQDDDLLGNVFYYEGRLKKYKELEHSVTDDYLKMDDLEEALRALREAYGQL